MSMSDNTPNVMPTPGGTPAPGPVRNYKRRQKIVLVVALVIVAGFFALAWQQTRHNGSNAQVGDCVKPKGEDSVTIVKCDDPDALKVVGRVENKTQIEAQIDACDAFASLGADQSYWTGEDGKTGLVLCLAPNT